MASSSSAADVSRQQKYDVFLSFRGEDTRRTFTSHLYDALCKEKIDTYIDDRLDRGDEIGPALLTAIEQSDFSVIIFSKDYASSSWCLDELVHILKCKQEHGQLVMPVFYNIDPSHVRKQEGTYADAFAILEKRFKNNLKMVCDWRAALTTAANLSGVDSQNSRSEAALLVKIVNDILTKLNHYSSYVVDGLVGMESRILQIESLLCISTQDACNRTIGIWGMGGLGKTTLADAVFNRNSSKFDSCLFLRNVRERSEAIDGLNCLRDELISKLLKEENISIGSPSIGLPSIIKKLSRTKVLIVLDDVSDLSQLKTLLANQVKFGRGSRIIITTRDRFLLKERVDEDHIYKMTDLSVDESLQLFQSIAFKDRSCITDYSDLSMKVVHYVGCNPLALTVLASSFQRCNNREVWKDELEKLKKFPNRTIQDSLRISYNGLGDNEKGIFLDIACFLKGENMSDAKKLLQMHGFYVSTAVEELSDRSLISIKDNRLEMHDLLQEMGRAIDRGIEEPGKRKRLWNAEDAYQVLHNNTGTSTIEAIFLDVSKIRELQLSPAAFRNMHNLQLLKFYATQEVHREGKRQRRSSVEEKQLSSFPGLKVVQSFLAWGSLKLLDVYRRVWNCDDKVFNEYCKVFLPGGLESLPEALRYLYWERYPLKSLPSQYYPKNLVELHLPNSQVKQLWNNVQNLGSLKHLNLSHSPHLIEVPDLSGCPNIERIDLSWCRSLVQIPSQFQNLEKLTDLDLQGCRNLKKNCVQNLGSLKHLNLCHSEHLTEVPDLSGCPNIETIDLGWSSLVEVPSYFQNLENLTCLNLSSCMNLKKICELPRNLEKLGLAFTAIEEISPSIWSHKKLHTLNLLFCRYLKSLPSSSSSGTGKLKCLILTGCFYLESVPDSIYNSNCLEGLSISDCRKLKRLPPLSLGRLCCLRNLNLSGCMVLEWIPDSLLSVSTLEEIDLSETMIESIPSSIINASGLRKLHLTNCKKLKVIPELPWQVYNLEAGGCTSLKSVASSRSALNQQLIFPKRKDFISSVGNCHNYTNCLELDESARRNIMGDAQLIIMRMASSSDHGLWGSKFTAICPGHEIPQWFSYDYEWEGSDINNIQFPKTKTTGTGPMKQICWNFIVSPVVSNSECALPSNGSVQLVCECNFKSDDGGELRTIFWYEFPLLWRDVNFEEDHVVTFFKTGLWRRCEKNSITQASFHLYLERMLPNRDNEIRSMKVKKCGICIL